MVEWDMHVCFLDGQYIAPSSSEKIHPDMDLLSLELIIQLASQYPSNTVRKS
jgi:hypothetical protein